MSDHKQEPVGYLSTDDIKCLERGTAVTAHVTPTAGQQNHRPVYLDQPDTIPVNQAPEGWKLVPLSMDENMQDAALAEEAKANQRGEPAAFTDLWEAIVKAAPEDAIPIPRTVDEARAMALTGHRWLKDNAPEQLTDTIPVKREVLQNLRDSISGDCYRGQEWEIETIETLLASQEESNDGRS